MAKPIAAERSRRDSFYRARKLGLLVGGGKDGSVRASEWLMA